MPIQVVDDIWCIIFMSAVLAVNSTVGFGPLHFAAAESSTLELVRARDHVASPQSTIYEYSTWVNPSCQCLVMLVMLSNSQFGQFLF